MVLQYWTDKFSTNASKTFYTARGKDSINLAPELLSSNKNSVKNLFSFCTNQYLHCHKEWYQNTKLLLNPVLDFNFELCSYR